MKLMHAWFICGLLPGWAGCQAATVTICTNERALSAGGLNLNDAVKEGGIVTFACPPGTSMRVTAPIYLTKDVVIDGGGSITLDGQRGTGIFIATNAVGNIELRRMAITNSALPAVRAPDAASVVHATAAQLRLVDVDVSASLLPFSVAGIEIQGGRYANNPGIVIRASTLRIQGNANFQGNGAPFRNPLGGAAGEATVDGAEFSGNQHIVWKGTLTMTNVRFLSNAAPDYEPETSGGALAVSGDVSISHSSFYGNRAAKGSGGAIAFGGGTLKLRRVEFRENTAAGLGGAVAPWSRDSARPVARVDIRYCSFTGNRALHGGALGIGGRPDDRWIVTTSTFKANSAQFSSPGVPASGGAMWLDGSASVVVSRSVFADNSSTGRGAAIGQRHSFTPATMLLVNSVVTGSVSSEGTGALTLANAELVNVTVAANSGLGVQPDIPALLFGNGARLNGRISLKNSIVSGNTRGNCGPMVRQVLWVDAGHNLQWPGNSCGPGVASADPQLDGHFMVAPGSPARGAGDLSVCRSAPVSGQDVYGEVRPHGSGSCTVGAVEDTIERRAVDRVVRARSPEELPALLRGLHDLVNRGWWGARSRPGGG